jgi:hypothetical protein
MTQAFGAYLQCYKNPYATYKCLESFRHFYPDTTIVLLSDNGYNYSEMAKHFNCIYIHEYENSTFIHEIYQDKHIINFNKLIERIIKVFHLIKEDYIMWLEDDVCINNRIQDMFKYDLNGFAPNTFLEFQIKELQKKYILNDSNKRTGHGGSVYHKNFLKYLQNKDIINDLLINWTKYKLSSNICQDELFSLIILLNKGTIGSYDGHYDCSFKNDKIIVQHQYKCWYKYPMPESLKHLVNQL